MTKSLSNSVHTNLDIFETVHSRLDSCWRCLNLIWKAVTKRCGFYEPISNCFHVNETPIRAKKNMRLPNIRSTFWLHKFTFPSHESIESADPNHTFLKPLSTVFLFLDWKDLRSRVDYHDWNRVCFILFTQVYTFSQPPPTPSPPGFVWTGSESETNTKKRSCHSVPGGKQSTIYNR